MTNSSAPSTGAPSSAKICEVRALRDFAELAGDWFWEQDADFRFTSIFGAAPEMMHRHPSEFLGHRRWDMPLTGITPAQRQAHIDTCQRHEPFRNFIYEVIGNNNTTQYYCISGAPVFDGQGAFIGYHGIGRNITEQRMAELDIQASQRKLSQIVDGSPVATFVIDASHRITHWNLACSALTGLAAPDLIGTREHWRAFYPTQRPILADLVVSGASHADIGSRYEHFSPSQLIEGAYQAERFFAHMGSHGRWLSFTAAPLHDASGNLMGAIETLQDTTEEHKAKAALEQLANQDALTGVANRRRFNETLDVEWRRARREGLCLTLLMIDIDHFKRYNDTYGHQAGDRCLQQVADALQAVACRPGDLIARYGGEEFAAILTTTDTHGAVNVANRILVSLRAQGLPHTGGEGGHVTVSIGIATMQPATILTQEALIATADYALYEAKHEGRNRYYLDPRTVTNSVDRLAFANAAAVSADQRPMPIASEMRALRDFAELSSDWFWEQGPDLRFSRFFGAPTEKLRRKQATFAGMLRWELPISGVNAQQMAEHIATCERHEPFRDFEYEILDEDGLSQHYCISGTPVFNAQGIFVGYHGVGRNTTDLHRAEQAVAAHARQMAQIVEGSSIATFVIDSQHQVTQWNQACANLTQLPALQMLGRCDAGHAFYGVSQPTLADLVLSGVSDEDIPQRYEKYARSALATGSIEAELFLPHLGGNPRWLFLTVTPLHDQHGTCTGAVETLQDITERRRAKQILEESVTQRTAELSQQLHFLQQLIEAIPGPVFYKDAQARYLGCNSAFAHYMGRPASEIVGKTPYDIAPPELAKRYAAADQELFDHPGAQIYESKLRYADGELRDVVFHKATFTQPDGTVGGLVGLIMDISERKRMEARIELLAFSDPVTELPNRQLLLDRLSHAVASAARTKRQGALFLIDLDDFKDLNDTLGHDTGDQLLRQVAQRLSACVREGDTVARLGGDEFVVMLEDLSENALDASSQAELVGEKILESLNQSYVLGPNAYHGTASIGVTLFGDVLSSVEELLKQADLAMYQAKQSGRHTLRYFDPAMQIAVSNRVALEAELREGMQREQFILHYQPQMNHLGQVTGAEALVRWMHPMRGLVPPADFIPLAEASGLILPLGNWVLNRACQQLRQWAQHPDTAHLTVAVNVSALQFREPNFVASVLAALQSSGAEPQRLKLELTESLLLDDIEGIIVKMTALKAHGVGFSLDDFGTGYSSLSYLKRLPLDQLKIDQSFVHGVLTNANDAAIARTVVALAHALGLSVMAEGVETDGQLSFLAENNCHAYQGYLFSRPLPIARFNDFMLSNRRSAAPDS